MHPSQSQQTEVELDRLVEQICDRIQAGEMVELDQRYPGYGLARHKGYPTKAHKAAVAQHGPSLIHRRTFRGVSEHC